jgi:hypothetical protein
MSLFTELRSVEGHPEWEDWVSSRPEFIQVMCRKWPPARYRMGDTTWPVVPIAYNEDGTIRVLVEDPQLPREVFGCDPETLTAWSDDGGTPEQREWISLIMGSAKL